MPCQPDHLCMCNVDKLFPPLVPPPVDKNGELDLCTSESSDTEDSDSDVCG